MAFVLLPLAEYELQVHHRNPILVAFLFYTAILVLTLAIASEIELWSQARVATHCAEGGIDSVGTHRKLRSEEGSPSKTIK